MKSICRLCWATEEEFWPAGWLLTSQGLECPACAHVGVMQTCQACGKRLSKHPRKKCRGLRAKLAHPVPDEPHREATRTASERVIVNRTAAYWEVLRDGVSIAFFSEHGDADLFASGVRAGLAALPVSDDSLGEEQ